MMCDKLEELGTPTRLGMIPDALLQEIAERVSCHEALAALSGTCKALRQIVSTALLEQCIKAMIEARGWMPWPSQLSARVARTVGTTSSVLEYYALRVASLPLPHSSWPRSSLLGSARALRVGGGACHFASLRAALESARDGDTLCLAAGIFDEGTLRVSASVRIVGAVSAQVPSATWGGTTSVLALATVLRAQLVLANGRGQLCRLTLTLPDATGGVGVPAATPGGLGGGFDAAEDPDMPPGATPVADYRCVAVGEQGIWALDDCVVHGGVRAGGHAEVAISGSEILGVLSRGWADLHAPPGSTSAAAAAAAAALSVAATATVVPARPSTGLLVQGNARVLCRATYIRDHLRSGVTVQHAARLWLHDCLVAGNALAGLKFFSRAPSELMGSVIEHNGHMGLLLRGAGMVAVSCCDLRCNALGAAVSGEAVLKLSSCIVEGHRNDGLVCHNSAHAIVEGSLVRRNTNHSVSVLQLATCTLLEVMSDSEPIMDESARVVYRGLDNHFGATEQDDAQRVSEMRELERRLEREAGAAGERIAAQRRHCVSSLDGVRSWPYHLSEAGAGATQQARSQSDALRAHYDFYPPTRTRN